MSVFVWVAVEACMQGWQFKFMNMRNCRQFIIKLIKTYACYFIKLLNGIISDKLISSTLCGNKVSTYCVWLIIINFYPSNRLIKTSINDSWCQKFFYHFLRCLKTLIIYDDFFAVMALEKYKYIEKNVRLNEKKRIIYK